MWSRIVSVLLRRDPTDERAEKGKLIRDQQAKSDAALERAAKAIHDRLGSYDNVKLRR